MSVFSRARDIFAANITEMLDRSEDPAKMIRMVILEMEETLVDVRASAARCIADGKEMRRALGKLDEMQSNWTEKAELALSKGREDLAKQALLERQKATDMAEGLKAEIATIEGTLKSYEADIAKLQGKLREARARQNAIANRFESAVTRARASEMLNGNRTEDASCAFRTAAEEPIIESIGRRPTPSFNFGYRECQHNADRRQQGWNEPKAIADRSPDDRQSSHASLSSSRRY